MPPDRLKFSVNAWNKNNLYEGNQNKVISEAVTNNITIRKVKKFDLSKEQLELVEKLAI